MWTNKNDIVNGVFLPKSDVIIFTEYGQKNIKIYSPKNGKNISSIDVIEAINEFKGVEDTSQKTQMLLADPKKKKRISRMGPNLSGQKAPAFSILFLNHYQNVIALCVSDKRILFFYYVNSTKIELIYEIHVPSLEKRIWYLPEHDMWLTSGTKLEKFSYFTLNQLDIDIKFKSKKFEYKLNKIHPFEKHFCDKMPHKGEILDVIEISKPQMIVTACMDGKIRLIDVSDRDVVKVWSHHNLGVRCLDYNPLIDNSGYTFNR